ncbi:hypothetical protein FH972_022734 [Carpinus fangiana]|uniref:40S ribosomal protein S12 n=1 Tax=Carpinus fangiana TaxID=176857 RepID=A0A5N6KVB5_9ROSI|nr:hypothetical protein FH972_022734 [Carpinus fangiana]
MKKRGWNAVHAESSVKSLATAERVPCTGAKKRERSNAQLAMGHLAPMTASPELDGAKLSPNATRPAARSANTGGAILSTAPEIGTLAPAYLPPNGPLIPSRPRRLHQSLPGASDQLTYPTLPQCHTPEPLRLDLQHPSRTSPVGSQQHDEFPYGKFQNSLLQPTLTESIAVKTFIRNVRAAKTIADERAVVQKEVRLSLASLHRHAYTNTLHRVRPSVLRSAKKVMTPMSGKHWTGLSHEQSHVSANALQTKQCRQTPIPLYPGRAHTLRPNRMPETPRIAPGCTNNSSSDLKHSNQYIVGLALCTLGNIASVEMSRDLFPEIETMLSTSNPYIRRKAALCAMRICRKVPDLQEHFLEKAKVLLNDRNHGVLMCGLTLATSICEAADLEGDEEGVIEMFKPITGSLVKVLKGLTTSGYAPEHDVTGIADPFLQVKILRLFRVLGRGDSEVSEQINDILAQVATNTDSSKNVGNSILYEAVLTILDIEADSGLRVLGVNILGKFLANKDNNIRYVALNTLIKVVAIEPNAVQRHRSTILDCLRDPDISIRRRALDLSFTLINESNVRVLIRELLAFLEVADNEFKPVMTSQIGIAADRYAPTPRWHIDTLLRVLALAGNYVKEQILSSFVRLVATSPDLQTYAAQKLYANLKQDISQEGQTVVGAWVIGEYGDALLKGGNYEEEDLVAEVHESDIIDLYARILGGSYATQMVTQYIVTSAMKLSTRFKEPGQIERLRRLLLSNQANLDVDIQQRAVEYANLFGHDEIRRGVLEKMPAPEIREEQRALEAPTKKRQSRVASSQKKPAKVTEQDMLLDLMGGDSDMPAADISATINGSQNNADLLADILGGGSSVQSPPAQSTSPTPAQGNNNDIMSLFDSSPSAATPAAPPSGPIAHPAYSKNGLSITISVRRDGPAAQATAKFSNTTDFETISGLALQVAVPKSQKLQLQALANDSLEPGRDATQGMRIVGVNGSDGEEVEVPVADEVEVPVEESSGATGQMSVLDALKGVLKLALIHDGLARGLREASKALDRRQAHMCVLNEACEEEAYKKLVVALCGEHKIPLIKVPDGKQLGEWAGLCQIDREGNARKVVNCSCVVVRDWGEESQERSILLNYFQTEQ